MEAMILDAPGGRLEKRNGYFFVCESVLNERVLILLVLLADEN
jgi:hypothetical protein